MPCSPVLRRHLAAALLSAALLLALLAAQGANASATLGAAGNPIRTPAAVNPETVPRPALHDHDGAAGVALRPAPPAAAAGTSPSGEPSQRPSQ